MYFQQFHYNTDYLFTRRLELAITPENHISPKASYNIYIDAYYLYYLIDGGVNPYDAKVQYDGLDHYGAITTISMTSVIPTELEDNAVYVIDKNNYQYIDLLEENKFKQIYHGNYYVYIKE